MTQEAFLEIPLSRGQSCKVSREDAHLAQIKWYAHSPGPGRYYAARRATVCGERVLIYMHREILGLTDRATVGDHVNRDTLDNRRDNLRRTDCSGNNRNRAGSGVHIHKQTGRWRAVVRISGQRLSLGLFGTESEAAEARMAALLRHGV